MPCEVLPSQRNGYVCRGNDCRNGENDVAVIVALTVVTIIAIAIALEREYTTDGALISMASPKPPAQFRQLF